jgi:hypothetical protein
MISIGKIGNVHFKSFSVIPAKNFVIYGDPLLKKYLKINPVRSHSVTIKTNKPKIIAILREKKKNNTAKNSKQGTSSFKSQARSKISNSVIYKQKNTVKETNPVFYEKSYNTIDKNIRTVKYVKPKPKQAQNDPNLFWRYYKEEPPAAYSSFSTKSGLKFQLQNGRRDLYQCKTENNSKLYSSEVLNPKCSSLHR